MGVKKVRQYGVLVVGDVCCVGVVWRGWTAGWWD